MRSIARHRTLLSTAAAALLLTAAGLAVAQQPPPNPPPNPLSNLLNRMFGGGNRRGVDGRTEPGDGQKPANGMSAAISSDARKLARVDRATMTEDWQEAVVLLQSILGAPQDSLWRRDDGRWVSLQAEAEARIAQLPDAGRRVYQSEYGPAAAQMLLQAEGAEALRTAAVVANRYYNTDAGKQAAAKVASLLFDRGEYRAAATWYARLLNEPAYRNAVDWRAKATYALVQAGEQTLAAPLLQSLAQEPARPLLGPAEQNETLAAWISKQPTGSEALPLLGDWRTLYGTAAHVGTTPPCVPLLLQRWQQPLTARNILLQQLQDLMLDPEDNQRAAIPSLSMVVVGRRVAFRTLRGLAVVDPQNGELLWEGVPGISAERLLAHEAPADDDVAFPAGVQIVEPGDVSFEQHPLTSLLFKDAGYGLLSSDGQRVFSVENSVLMPPASFGWWGNNSPETQDPYKRDWSSNQIHAYDLETGERQWEAGGRRMHEQFDPALAGAFFLGPPVEDDGELFVIGEQDGEITLFALSPETGGLLWSQDLAPTEAGIDQDLVRRMWAAMPAVDAGMVVCPTTAGRLVAVDRHTHRIVWVYDFVARSGVTPGEGLRLHPIQGLNDRWCTSAPILAAGRVVFAPPELPNSTGEEQPRLICVDARTGERLWDLAKGSSLYVAGVFGKRVVLVGQLEATAVDLADGKPLWSVPVPAPAGPPSGRGIAVGEQYLLPLASGALWTIDMPTGNVVRRDRRPGGDDVPPLGNLGVWNGMLLSLGPFGLTGFEQRTALQEQIAERRARNPADLWAAVRDAEIHMVAGEYGTALEVLDHARPDSADEPELHARRRRLTFETLLTLVREKSEERSAAFERSAEIAEGDAERLEVDQLTVERHIAAGRWESAADACQSIAGKFALDTMIEDGLNRLRLDVWLGGRLSAIVAQAPPKVAESLAERIAGLLESSSLELPAAASLERIYGFHPAAQHFVWRLIEDAAYRKDFACAELRLRRLMEAGDRTTAAAAVFRLGELLTEFDQPDDAAVAFTQLESLFGDVVLPTLQTGAEAARQQFASGRLDRAALKTPMIADWTADRFRLHRFRVVNPEYSTPLPPVTRRLDAAFYRRHFIEFDVQPPQMSILRCADNGAYWRIPLRVNDTHGYNQGAALAGVGLQAVVLHRGVMHALSLPDRKVLWSRIAAEPAPPFARQIYEDDAPTLMPVGMFLTRCGLVESHPPTGMLALATSRYVACYGRNEILILDPLTGDVLWRRRGVLPHTTLKGNAQTLFVIPPNGAEPFALQAADGRSAPAQDLAARVRNAVAVTPSGLVRIDRKPGPRTSGAVAARLKIFVEDPLSGESAWQHEFGAKSRLMFLDDRQLLVLEEPSGRCALLQLDSGKLQPLGDIPAALLKSAEMSAIADPQRVYLVFNDGGGGGGYVHPPALRVNGTIVSLSRDGSGVIWQQVIENQNLLRQQFAQSPLLVCLAYDHVHRPDIDTSYTNGRLLVLDKGDGHVVAEETRANPNSNYYRLDVNRAERAIDIRAHNERLRIQAVPKEPVGAGG